MLLSLAYSSNMCVYIYICTLFSLSLSLYIYIYSLSLSLSASLEGYGILKKTSILLGSTKRPSHGVLKMVTAHRLEHSLKILGLVQMGDGKRWPDALELLQDLRGECVWDFGALALV